MLLRTFGGLAVEADAGDGRVAPIGPRRLALLALVAAGGNRGITRDRILGILWAETDEEQARHTLSQTLYLLRRETGREWIEGGAQLRLAATIRSDVGDFLEALSQDELARAAACHTGPFLEGFYLAGAPEFGEWVEETRAHLQFAAIRALETLARRASEAGAEREALNWWRRLGELDPFSATFALGRIRAHIAIGDRSGALQFGRQYESRLRRELDTAPDPLIAELIGSLRVAHADSPATPQLLPAPATRLALPPAEDTPRPPRAVRSRWPVLVPAGIAAVSLFAFGAWNIRDARASRAPPFLAIGTIHSRDTAATGPVLRDMLATNLARIAGIRVVSNSRLLELLPGGPQPASATADAARRAGASEIIEGELAATAGGLVLSLRRVALQSGVVRHGYTLRAADAYALIDSATAAIADDFRLDPPSSAVATVRTRSGAAYGLYEEGLRAFYSGDAPSAFRLMTAALERDSAFAMAAYYAWLSARSMRHQDADRLLPIVRRLATRAVERERLLIQSSLAGIELPVAEFLGITRELTAKYPEDPDGHVALGQALQAAGDWAGAAAAFERAIAIDSAAGAIRGPICRVCSAMHLLVDTYIWWDSAGRAEATGRRLIALLPNEHAAWGARVEVLLRLGRRADAEAAIVRASTMSGVTADFSAPLDRDLIRSGRLDELEAKFLAELHSAQPDPRTEIPWLLTIALRNQGRLAEARRLATDGEVPGSDVRFPKSSPDRLSLGSIALEAGEPRESARWFLEGVALDHAASAPLGIKSRYLAWHMTLAATALAAAGDTAALRAWADSVARIGASSSLGRDQRLHHFLHGLLLQHQDRHAEAVEAFRRSLFSVTDGYTRTNLEMARSLVRLGRYPEAIAILQAALRGGVDGSNTYLTQAELRFALARAFESAGQRDSAAVYFAAVERAWRRADPGFADRYREAKTKAALLKIPA